MPNAANALWNSFLSIEGRGTPAQHCRFVLRMKEKLTDLFGTQLFLSIHLMLCSVA